MANKISIMLCMFFLLQFVIFCGDIIGYQLAISRAYSAMGYINSYVAERGVIDEEIQDYVSETLSSSIECITTCSASSGSSIDYRLEVSFQPTLGIIKDASGEITLEQRVYVR